MELRFTKTGRFRMGYQSERNIYVFDNNQDIRNDSYQVIDSYQGIA